MARRAEVVYRRTQLGWMFNVSGLDAVELSLASGARFRIGTDRPDELFWALAAVTTLARSAGTRDRGLA